MRSIPHGNSDEYRNEERQRDTTSVVVHIHPMARWMDAWRGAREWIDDEFVSWTLFPVFLLFVIKRTQGKAQRSSNDFNVRANRKRSLLRLSFAYLIFLAALEKFWTMLLLFFSQYLFVVASSSFGSFRACRNGRRSRFRFNDSFGIFLL